MRLDESSATGAPGSTLKGRAVSPPPTNRVPGAGRLTLAGPAPRAPRPCPGPRSVPIGARDADRTRLVKARKRRHARVRRAPGLCAGSGVEVRSGPPGPGSSGATAGGSCPGLRHPRPGESQSCLHAPHAFTPCMPARLRACRPPGLSTRMRAHWPLCVRTWIRRVDTLHQKRRTNSDLS